MSWETTNREKSACGCDLGYVLRETRSDDWNRTEENATLHCIECQTNFVAYSYDVHRSGMTESIQRWVRKDDYEVFERTKREGDTIEQKARTQLTEYLRTQYLDRWMSIFEEVPRNKKAVWTKLKQINMINISYSNYCKRTSDLEEDIVSYVSTYYVQPLFKVLIISSEPMIESINALPNEARQRHNEARVAMMKRSFS
ncbi:hypothetical protein [Paenibacillus agricola]|uniref:Zinc finger protein n=1 Tax=Paenibacillus agricola TaxID=2716264 RepID=A0ABX0JC36_9BACL|nr:hypothetical protein [Paenibacillus agricola]NHN33123.1 hypothetical protein [Paenibacillus agricola]